MNHTIETLDYEIIQHENTGMKFWIDYSNMVEDDPKKLQFLKNILIKNAITRISSIMKPHFRERLGPFSKLALMNCEDDFFKISDFYTKTSIRNSNYLNYSKE